MKIKLVVAIAVFALFSSTSAFSEITSAKLSNQLVVRYNTQSVIKLTYKTAQEAMAARAELLKDPNVVRVAPNFRYHLAIHLQARPVPAEETFLDVPFPGEDLRRQPTDSVATIPDAELPGPVTPGVDPLAANDWAVQSIDLPPANAVQALQAGQQPLVAAVIDTGVDYNHEDLVGAMWRDPSDPHTVGYDFVHNTNKPYDVRHFDLAGCMTDPNCTSGQTENLYLTNPGHGTHCAGHVGAVANNSLGIRGMGGKVQVMALKFFYDYTDGANAGGGDDAAAVQAIDYAIAHGVKVISASWGGRMAPQDAEQSELKAALIRAQRAGVLFVVAAGNDGINLDSDAQPDYPAAYASKDGIDNILVVAASNQDDSIASFSNYGAQGVDIAAPGVKILSTTVGSTYNDVVATYTDSQGQQQEMDWDGTSMATPIVAGAAALIWSKYPDESYLQIKNRILQAARPVAALQGKVSTGGVLDVSAALGL